MSESKHTEGPWYAVYWDETVTNNNPYWSVECNMPDVINVAQVSVKHSGYTGTAAEAEGNAKLIAASPDMLEALEAFDAQYTYFVSLWSEEGVTRRVADKVRAAIKKARGL